MHFIDVNFGKDGVTQAEALRRRLRKAGSVAIRRKQCVRVVHTSPHDAAATVSIILTEMGLLSPAFTLNIFRRHDEENPPDIGDTYATNNFTGSREGVAGEVI